MYRTAVAVALSLVVIGLTDRPASAQLMAKAQVANLIAKVENGVDDFRKYLENRGENAREASSTAQASGRKKRQATESQKATASSKKDALDRAPNGHQRSGASVWSTADGDLANHASRIGRSVVFKGHAGLVAGATVRSIARPDNDTA